MVAIKIQEKEIVINIVYFGPPGSGKKTWIRFLHAHSPGSSNLIEQSTGEKTLSFKLPTIERIAIDGTSYSLSFTFTGCSSDIENKNHPSEPLSQADGIVFIADSSPLMAEENILYRNYMQELLSNSGIELTDENANIDAAQFYQPGVYSKEIAATKIPWVLACNKRDRANRRPIGDLENDLKIADVPVFECIATEGIGTFGPFMSLKHRVIFGIDQLNRRENG
jgi:signal recognition particle receptor subunit beta